MEDGFGYVLQIQDKMSGPAAASAKSLRDLSDEIKLADKALNQFQQAQVRYKDQGIKVSVANEAAKVRLYRSELKQASSEKVSQLRAEKAGVDAAAEAERRKLKIEQEELKNFIALKKMQRLSLESVPDIVAPKAASAGGGFGSTIFPFTAASLYATAIREVARETERAAFATVEFIQSAAELKQTATLAYEAVQGSAGAARETFVEINAAAVAAHLPIEKAHDLARDLMLQGVTDTHLIASTIGAQAALIRTGQLQGAEKLRGIIEKSEASGHFEVRGLAGGKGGAAGSGRALAGLGVHAPELLDNLAKRLNTSVADVKAQLTAGKIAADVGIAAIVDTINQGSIGKAAREKFGLEDFKTDVVNTFSEIAQNVSLDQFTQSLVDAEAAVTGLTDRNGGLKDTFQTIIDGVAHGIDGLALFGLNVEGFVLDVQLATIGMDLFDASVDTASGTITLAGTAMDVARGAFFAAIDVVDALSVGVESLAANLAFLADTAAHPLNIGANFGALEKTVKDLGAGYVERSNRRADTVFGTEPKAVRHGGEREPVGISVGRDAKPLPGFADGGTVPRPQSPDSVFVAARPGETILPRGFDANAIALAVQQGMSQQASQPARVGSESRPQLHIGAIYLDREHASGEHLRPIVESVMFDVLERIQLELGG